MVKYDFWNYSEDSKPVKKWAQESINERYPLDIVHQGRMFYTNHYSKGLTAMKLANGQYVHFDISENPTARADVFGNGVYVGQTDGLFHAYNRCLE